VRNELTCPNVVTAFAADAAKMLTFARAFAYAGVEVMSLGIKRLWAAALLVASQKRKQKSAQ
jgi:hypothetical protein